MPSVTRFGPEILHPWGQNCGQKPGRRDGKRRKSPCDRRQVGWQKDPQLSSVTNGDKLAYRQLLCVGAPIQGHHQSAHLGSRCEDNCSAAEPPQGSQALARARCCGLPIRPEVDAIALSLELIRGHDPEAGFEERVH